MRVLFISNFSTLRCGVAVYGKIWADALRAAGVDVVEWDGTYSTIVLRGHKYLPDDLSGFDLIHLNWDPQAINHFLPQHFPPEIPLSLFLHDVPPNSTCPVWDVAALRMAYESAPGIDAIIDHAIPEFGTAVGERDPTKIVIGVTGIRDDAGARLVEQLCKREGWEFNCPPWWNSGPWLTTASEIARLSRSTVNVCWYYTSGRGKSMAAMFCCAAGRPLLLSGSSMFSALWGYEDEITICRETHYNETPWRFEEELEEQLLRMVNGQPPVPQRVNQELAWSVRAREIKGLWEGVAKR